MKTNGNLPYLIAGVKGLQLAISAGYVREIIKVPQWYAVPQLPNYVRGVINLRGKVIPLMDLRLRMNQTSALEEIDETVKMLSAREQDHIHWLDELELSIKDKRPFTLARDPAKCAFGKWYYSFKTNDIGFASVMSRFEAPHSRIHAIADTAINYAEQGEFDKAKEIIEVTRTGDLSSVIKLFAEAREAFVQSHMEIAVVLTHEEKHMSIAVDTVVSVELLNENTIEDTATVMGNDHPELLVKVARRIKDKSVVFLLDVEKLFD